MEIDLQVQGISLSSFEKRIIKAGIIQAHGLLLVLQPELTIVQDDERYKTIFWVEDNKAAIGLIEEALKNSSLPLLTIKN